MAWETPNGETYQGIHCILNHSYERGFVTCGEEILYYSNEDGTLSPMPEELAKKVDMEHLLKPFIFGGSPELEKLIPRPSLPPKVEQWIYETREKSDETPWSLAWYADLLGHYIVFRMDVKTVITVLNEDATILCQTKFYRDVVRGVYLNAGGNLCYYTETNFARRANRNSDSIIKVFCIK